MNPINFFINFFYASSKTCLTLPTERHYNYYKADLKTKELGANANTQ